MAKVQMQKVRVCGLMTDCGAVLEALQRLEVMQIDRQDCGDFFQSIDTGGIRRTFENAMDSVEKALSALDVYAPKKSGLLDSYKPRPTLSDEDYDALLQKSDRLLRRAAHILRCSRRLEELAADRVLTEQKIDRLSPYSGLDLPLNFSGTQSSCAVIGYLPTAVSRQDLLTMLGQVDPVEVDIISSKPDMTCFMAVSLEENREALENALRAVGFSYPVETCRNAPVDEIAKLRLKLESIDKESEANRDKLVGYAESRQELRYLYDYYRMRLDRYEVFDRLACTDDVFIMSGWIPAEKYGELSAQTEKLGAYCEKIEPDKNEDPPILLRNGGFAEGGEPVLEMFSLPSRKDIDPTPFMAFFYYLLFGIMLGDAAYGIIMVLATAFVIKKLRPEPSKRKTMKLFCFSGAASIISGFVFGSFFGDLPNVIAHTFFGVPEDVLVFRPLWFDPISEPMKMMYFSIGIGAVHVLFGLVLGMVTAFKNRDPLSAFCDYGSWLGMLVAIIAWALLSMIELPFTVPAIVSKLLIGIAIFSALVILFMSGRSSKSPFKRIMKGAYALYGATGYISDFMSYSRLLALGLATSVISSVFNQMGSMVAGGKGILGAFLMLIVCLIGHVFNILTSLISCYVHTCRLQYVEFFGKFYEGGGNQFVPLGINTKYIKLKEEKQ